MARRPSVAIVGCGRAGGAIGLALRRAGYRIAGVWSRSGPGRRRATRLLGAPSSRSISKVIASADLIFVTTPDEAIAEVASELAPCLHGRQVWVAHCSGVTSVEVLEPCRAAGARVASLHPLQTLPDPSRGAAALRGAAVAVTCPPPDTAFWQRIATAWGGVPFELADEAKPRYHAAAVFASNYLIASLWASVRLLEEAGVPSPHVLLGPLARASIDNATEVGPERAMTGPVVRSDVTTIRTHLGALGADPSVADAYRSLGRLVFSLAALQERAVKEALL